MNIGKELKKFVEDLLNAEVRLYKEHPELTEDDVPIAKKRAAWEEVSDKAKKVEAKYSDEVQVLVDAGKKYATSLEIKDSLTTTFKEKNPKTAPLYQLFNAVLITSIVSFWLTWLYLIIFLPTAVNILPGLILCWLLLTADIGIDHYIKKLAKKQTGQMTKEDKKALKAYLGDEFQVAWCKSVIADWFQGAASFRALTYKGLDDMETIVNKYKNLQAEYNELVDKYNTIKSDYEALADSQE